MPVQTNKEFVMPLQTNKEFLVPLWCLLSLLVTEIMRATAGEAAGDFKARDPSRAGAASTPETKMNQEPVAPKNRHTRVCQICSTTKTPTLHCFAHACKQAVCLDCWKQADAATQHKLKLRRVKEYTCRTSLLVSCAGRGYSEQCPLATTSPCRSTCKDDDVRVFAYRIMYKSRSICRVRLFFTLLSLIR